MANSHPHLRLLEGDSASDDSGRDLRYEIVALLRANPQGLEPVEVSRRLGSDRVAARPLEVSLGLLIVAGQLEASSGRLRLVGDAEAASSQQA